jgi:AcrR family transcriptional regulator
MELYSERGYEQTTVAEIAGRAGLTERTFFRHFADKREVLFAGAEAFQEVVLGGVAGAAASAAPIDAAIAGVEAVAAFLQEGRDFSRRRQVIIAANTELQERELIKLATLAAAIASALRQRGVEDPAASLAAEAAVAVFRISFERWVADGEEMDLSTLIRRALDELRAVTTG